MFLSFCRLIPNVNQLLLYLQVVGVLMSLYGLKGSRAFLLGCFFFFKKQVFLTLKGKNHFSLVRHCMNFSIIANVLLDFLKELM